MPDQMSPIEGQYFIDSDNQLRVMKRNYATKQVGKTEEKEEGGEVISGGAPIMESVPVGDIYPAPTGLSPQQENRVRGMMTVHDNARELFRMERAGESNPEVESKRTQLKAMHTEFVRRYGNLNLPENINVFKQDPGASFLQSLEVQRGGKWYGSDVFSRRQLQGSRRPPAKTASDAMVTVMDERGKLDFDRMGEILSRPADEVRTELAGEGYIYHDPINQTWETSDVYLTGSIRGKIDAARIAAGEDPSYYKNIEELEKNVPERLKAYDITVNLGAGWIPEELITQWYHDVVHRSDTETKMRYTFDPTIGQWIRTSRPRQASASADEWGVSDLDIPAWKIIDAVMANRIIDVKTKGVDGKDRRDPQATMAVQTQAQRMKDSFQRWIVESPELSKKIEDVYNDKMNDIQARVYEGSHQTFPGMNVEWQQKIRPHQRDAIFRTVQDGTALLAHEVGFGKTLSMSASAMERRRLELSDKPFFVMPKTVHGQFKREFQQYYPDAKILFPEDGAFNGRNKANFLARARDGDWDAVVLTMENFKAIPVRPEVAVWWQEDRTNEIKDRHDDIQSKLGSMKPDDPDWSRRDELQAIQSQLGKSLKTATGRLNKRISETSDHYGYEGNRDAIYFEDLGADQLYVDEADNYKNLGYDTKIGSVKGLTNSDSKRSMDMFLKAQLVQGNARSTAAQDDPSTFSKGGVVFATGTPVANTIAETWTMMRYLQLDELRRRNMHTFDSWAANYGKVVTDIEQTPQGTYRDTNRFSSFNNLPELSKLFQRVADVRVASEVNDMMEVQPRLVDDQGGHKRITEKAPGYPSLRAYVKDLENRADNLPNVDPSEDNMLKIASDARKASLDIRMVEWPEHIKEPRVPNEVGKIQLAARNIAKVYEEEAEDKGVQIVFLDLGTPRAASGKDKTGDVEKDDNDELVVTAADQEILKDVYRLIREDLVERGIPDDKIAFIHDHGNKEAQARLFDQVREGDVRVLVGSTAKLGVGVNIQDRAAALHHIDVPWRPRDLEQREGRIIRQGNKVYGPVIDEATREILHEGRGVKIYNYAQEGSFDEFMWQGVEKKGIAIKSLMRRYITQREVEDVDPLVMTASELKALSSGDLRVSRLVGLKQNITKLRLERILHDSGQNNARERIRMLEEREERQTNAIPGLIKDGELAEKLTESTPVLNAQGEVQKDKDGKIITRHVNPTQIKVGQQDFQDRVAAGVSIIGLLKDHRSAGEWKTLGEFQGLKLEAYNAGNHHVLSLTNPETGIRHESTEIMADRVADRGVVRRLDFVLDDMIGKAGDIEDRLEDTKRQLSQYRGTLGKTFEKSEELDDIEAQAEIIQGHLSEFPDATNQEIEELLGDVHEVSDESRLMGVADYRPTDTREEVLVAQSKLRDAAASRLGAEEKVREDEIVEEVSPSSIDLGTIELPVSGPRPKIEYAKVAEGERPEASSKNPYPMCICGCGVANNPGARVKTGHDMKVKGILNSVAEGRRDPSAMPTELLEAATSNPDFFIGKFTAEDVINLSGGRAMTERTPAPPKESSTPGDAVVEDGITGEDMGNIAAEAASEAVSEGATEAKVNVVDPTTGETAKIIVKKEPDGEFKIQPTARHKFPYCLDGCGEETKPGKRFKPGHDPKLKSLLNKVKAGTVDASNLPSILVEAVLDNTPDTQIVGNWLAGDIAEMHRQATPTAPTATDRPGETPTTGVTATTAIETTTRAPVVPREPAPPKPARDPDDPPDSFIMDAVRRERVARTPSTAKPEVDRELDDVDKFVRKYAIEETQGIEDTTKEEESIVRRRTQGTGASRPSYGDEKDDDIPAGLERDIDYDDDDDDEFFFRQPPESIGRGIRPGPRSGGPRETDVTPPRVERISVRPTRVYEDDDTVRVPATTAFRMSPEGKEWIQDNAGQPVPQDVIDRWARSKGVDPKAMIAISDEGDVVVSDSAPPEPAQSIIIPEVRSAPEPATVILDPNRDDDESDGGSTKPVPVTPIPPPVPTPVIVPSVPTVVPPIPTVVSSSVAVSTVEPEIEMMDVPDQTGVRAGTYSSDPSRRSLYARGSPAAAAIAKVSSPERAALPSGGLLGEEIERMTDYAKSQNRPADKASIAQYFGIPIDTVEFIIDKNDEYKASISESAITASSDDDAPENPYKPLSSDETDNVVERVTERVAEEIDDDLKENDGVAVLTSETLDSMIVEETRDEKLLEGVPSESESKPPISLENIPSAPTPSIKVDDVVTDSGPRDRGVDKSMVDPGTRGSYSSSESRYQQRGGRGKRDFKR